MGGDRLIIKFRSGLVPLGMFSNNKLRTLFLAFVIVVLLGFISFVRYVRFSYPHNDTMTVSQLHTEMMEGDSKSESLKYPSPTVVLKQTTESTWKTEFHHSSGVNMTMIFGRRSQRIKLVDSLLLDKVHISVRTSAKFHHSRLDLLLLTWLQTTFPSNVSI